MATTFNPIGARGARRERAPFSGISGSATRSGTLARPAVGSNRPANRQRKLTGAAILVLRASPPLRRPRPLSHYALDGVRTLDPCSPLRVAGGVRRGCRRLVGSRPAFPSPLAASRRGHLSFSVEGGG